MRLTLLSAALLLAGAPAFADPIGQYEIVGTNPDNSGEYAGTVTVSRNGDTYKVIWKIGDSQTIGVGVGGRRVGDENRMGPATPEDTILSVAYSSGDTVGTALYSEDPDGVWRGVWAYDGAARSATEVWTPAKKKVNVVKAETRELNSKKSLSTPLPAQNGPRQ